MNLNEAHDPTAPDIPKAQIAFAKTIPETRADIENRVTDPGAPALIDMLLQTPVDILLADARRKEELLIEKKTKLHLVIDLILKKVPNLNPIAIERLRVLRETRNAEMLYKGFSDKGLPTYLTESANGDAEEEKKAMLVFNRLHKLVHEIKELENHVLPNFSAAIEIQRKRATPPPLPKETQKAPSEQPNDASGVRPIIATPANPPADSRAA